MGSISVTQTSWSALKRKDMRSHRRYLVDAGVLQVSWLDASGNMKVARTRALNISEGGMALELPEAAMPLSMVRFQSDRFKVRGMPARCGNCRRVGSKWIAGNRVHRRTALESPRGRGERSRFRFAIRTREGFSSSSFGSVSPLSRDRARCRIQAAPARQTWRMLFNTGGFFSK